MLLADERVWLRVTRPEDEAVDGDEDADGGGREDGAAAAVEEAAAAEAVAAEAEDEMRRDDRSGISKRVRSFWRLSTVW